MSAIFDEPVPFLEAMGRLEEKQLLPTSMSSAEIRELLAADVRDRALFSARTTKAAILEDYRTSLGALVNGTHTNAEVRAWMQESYDALGYSPEHGFAGDEDLQIPPAEKGDLRDLSSNSRIDLVLRTNVSQMANYGYREQGQSEFSLYAYPAYELVRIYPRRVPRGLKEVKGAIVEDPGQDWPSRWYEVGGQFYGSMIDGIGGRMIARKDSPIWAKLGSTEIFRDALGTDLPPFAWNSGYGWKSVRRDECIKLGVIKESDEVQRTAGRPVNAGLQADVSQMPAPVVKAITEGLDAEIEDGKVKLAATAKVAREEVTKAGDAATLQQKRAATAAEWEARYFDR
jgi:hypothetical protein